MLQVGDQVYIEDSAQVDVTFIAWLYIKEHRTATVKAIMNDAQMGVQVKPGQKRTPDYALEWPESFVGGINCYKYCKAEHGQFVNERNLSLNFEASREVVTVPNITG